MLPRDEPCDHSESDRDPELQIQHPGDGRVCRLMSFNMRLDGTGSMKAAAGLQRCDDRFL